MDPSLSVTQAVLELALTVYDSLRGDRAMPTPSDVDPLRLPRELLPHVGLIDVEHAPKRRLRWRLLGTHITEALGRDMSGRYWDEIYSAEDFDALSKGPNWAIEHRRPVRVIGTAGFANKAFILAENVTLPLSEDGKQVERLMVAAVYGLGDEA